MQYETLFLAMTISVDVGLNFTGDGVGRRRGGPAPTVIFNPYVASAIVDT